MPGFELRFKGLATAIGAAAIAAGCATNEPIPELVDARRAVQSAESQTDPNVASLAGEELERARAALERAEATFEEEGRSERERVAHEAYLAERYAELAMSEAEGAQLEREIEDAEGERAQVLLAARTEEARRAEQQAEQARRQVQQTEEARRSAEAEARELAARIEQIEAQQTERGLVLTLDDVLFDFDRASINPGGESAIGELARFLSQNENRNILIEGYTDSTGPEAYNRDLSERRAQAVRDALVDEGIASRRIQTRGLGESDPIATNSTVAGRQLNRRVEVVISGEDGSIPSSERSARLER